MVNTNKHFPKKRIKKKVQINRNGLLLLKEQKLGVKCEKISHLVDVTLSLFLHLLHLTCYCLWFFNLNKLLLTPNFQLQSQEYRSKLFFFFEKSRHWEILCIDQIFIRVFLVVFSN